MKRADTTITLKPKREKSLFNRHPWVFSGAIARVEGDPRPGDTVEIVSADGHWLARAAYSPRSQIRARVWDFDPAIAIDRMFFADRLQAAIGLRRRVRVGATTNAYRLVNGESDGLPGLIVDQYDGWLVCQFLASGVERWKATIVDCLEEQFPRRPGIFERSDVDVRKKEGLALATGPLRGDNAPERIDIVENGCRYQVDIRKGHKTGFYLDQRENRARLMAYAADATILNCFSYTGGFAVAALSAGAAHVVNVDASKAALDQARIHVAINDLAADRSEYVAGDVFRRLRRYHADGRSFDLIVLDPPKFVHAKGDLMRASRGYKDINRLAFELLRPGGTLFTFSCSGLLDAGLFQKIVADAALDAGRPAVILERLGQAADHPTALNFPEGYYLKGLVCQVR